ncbi:hypothetical protein F2Q69_00037559 [Brassica cretica]|uniref:Post-GPI attachment to proteins factor 3 n=1 Tax=Brassica cretica TaxID=69181 RepID=A0A8S9SJD2_BRACR|nr:hypothetical protein F2Q69_00037559 [Brassica cretica]
MVNSWEPLYSGNYMKSKKANKKFDFKVFTETGPKTSLITDGTQQSWNMIVCVAMGVAQLFLWARWTAVSRHPSNWELWVVVIASYLAMLLEIYDFPPYGSYFDAHSLWHLTTVPLTILWWSFIRDDDESRTSSLLK